MTRQTGFRLVFLGTMAVCAMMLLVSLFPYDTQRLLLTESGPFEALSVVGYVICILLMFLLWPVAEVAGRWYLPVVLALFACRELDLDKIPFTEGLLKARQYTGDTVPTGELIWSGAILIGVVLTVLTLLIREIPGFFAKVFMARPACHAVLVGLLFIGMCKSIDGLERKLAPYGIDVSDGLNRYTQIVEEVGEFGIPVMFGIAIYLSAAALSYSDRRTDKHRNEQRA